MKVRDLHWDDFEPLANSYLALYDERDAEGTIGISLFDERPKPSGEVAWFSDLYRRVLEREVIVAVAEVDGRAVGACTIAPAGGSAPPSETSHVGVLGILVERTHRGRGCGRALMERALAEARGRFERVRLGVFSTNPRARQLYERFGFRSTGRWVGEIRRGERRIDLEWMTLELPPGDGPKR